MFTGLNAFRHRYNLSTRVLARLCGDSSAGISKSSVDRLCRGIADPKYVARIKPVVLAGISKFLAEKGKSASEIEAELRTIFPTLEALNDQPAAVHTVIVPTDSPSAYIFKSQTGRTLAAFEFSDNQS